MKQFHTIDLEQHSTIKSPWIERYWIIFTRTYSSSFTLTLFYNSINLQRHFRTESHFSRQTDNSARQCLKAHDHSLIAQLIIMNINRKSLIARHLLISPSTSATTPTFPWSRREAIFYTRCKSLHNDYCEKWCDLSETQPRQHLISVAEWEMKIGDRQVELCQMVPTSALYTTTRTFWEI